MKKRKPKKPSALWERLKEATPELEEVERTPYFKRICEVAQPSVSRWRTGTGGLNLPHAKAISQDTGFCIQYLIDGNGPRRWDTNPVDIDELAEHMDRASEKGRAEIVRFAKWKAEDYTDSDDKT